MKPLYSGHHRDLKIASATERCPLHGGSSQTGLFCFKNLLLLGFGVYGNQPQSVSRDQFWEKEEPIGNILEGMFTTWQPLAGECLKYVEEPTNKVDKNTVAPSTKEPTYIFAKLSKKTFEFRNVMIQI